MKRRPIHRGGIVSAGYDPARGYLDIEFDTKRVLRYEDVGRAVAERFLNSAEPVAYYHEVIAEEYTASELPSSALKDEEEAPHPVKKGIPDELLKLFGDK